MLGDDEIREMEEHIAQMQKELSERKRQLNESKFSSLMKAVEARRKADEEIANELNRLGYRAFPKFYWL